ncbi:hypothetical protein VNO77_03776 [Canavalia gladiata]|uniref:Uncharacterized protein n=1 Tax=Canavalia gladiata TaxID=3824 RepID=A0AAN9R759_CANGL
MHACTYAYGEKDIAKSQDHHRKPLPKEWNQTIFDDDNAVLDSPDEPDPIGEQRLKFGSGVTEFDLHLRKIKSVNSAKGSMGEIFGSFSKFLHTWCVLKAVSRLGITEGLVQEHVPAPERICPCMDRYGRLVLIWNSLISMIPKK